MAPKIDPNEIKVGIHVIGGTTEESGFGMEIGGPRLEGRWGRHFVVVMGRDEAGGGHRRAKAEMEVERGSTEMGGTSLQRERAVYACVCACVRVDKDQEEWEPRQSNPEA
jgi:hypothetical protein